MRGLSRAGGDQATWHVMNRGAQGLRVFGAEGDRARFLTLLRTFAERAGMKILAYAVMPNHYHVMARGRGEALTKCFHEVDRLAARAYNERHGQKGHVFQGRFLSFIQRPGGWAARTSRYIHLNPVGRGGRRPEESDGTSYRTYLGQRRDEGWVHPQEILRLFAADVTKARTDYRRFVEAGLEPLRSRQDVPEERLIRASVAAEVTAGVPGLIRLLQVGEEEARRLAAYHGRLSLGVPVGLLADSLGFGAATAVSNGIQRVRKRMAESASYRALVARAGEFLDGLW